MPTKEPWNNEIYQAMKETDGYTRKERTDNENKKPLSTRFLTFLVVLMFILVGLVIAFLLYNNQIESNDSIKSFYQEKKSSSSSVKASSSSTVTSSSKTSTSSSSTSSSEPKEATYTVAAGDYPAAIASKTGLTWEQIVKLNPTLNPDSPGYYKDGSQLTEGQVLKLK